MDTGPLRSGTARTATPKSSRSRGYSNGGKQQREQGHQGSSLRARSDNNQQKHTDQRDKFLQCLHKMLSADENRASFLEGTPFIPGQILLHGNHNELATKVLKRYFPPPMATFKVVSRKLKEFGFTIVDKSSTLSTFQHPSVKVLGDVLSLRPKGTNPSKASNNGETDENFMVAQNKRPTFVQGLYNLLRNDSGAVELVEDANGYPATIQIHVNRDELETQILPNFFPSNNWNSFRSSLRSYNFSVSSNWAKGPKTVFIQNPDVYTLEDILKLKTKKVFAVEPTAVQQQRQQQQQQQQQPKKVLSSMALLINLLQSKGGISFREGHHGSPPVLAVYDKQELDRRLQSCSTNAEGFLKRMYNYGFRRVKDTTEALYENESVEEFNDIFYLQATPTKRMSTTYVAERNPKQQKLNNTKPVDPTLSNTLELGSRAYAKYPENGWHYFCLITNIVESDKETTYDVTYFDGDKEKGLKRHHIYTDAEYSMGFQTVELQPVPPALRALQKKLIRSRLKLDPKAVSEQDTQWSKTGQPFADDRLLGTKKMSLEKIFKARCSRCAQCIKDDCGKCANCLYNKSRDIAEWRVCYHKMCEYLPLSERQRPIAAFPPGWTFVVEHKTFLIPPLSTPGGIPDVDIVPGLSLVSPAGVRFHSVLRAKNRYSSLTKKPNIEAELYTLLGAKVTNDNMTQRPDDKSKVKDPDYDKLEVVDSDEPVVADDGNDDDDEKANTTPISGKRSSRARVAKSLAISALTSESTLDGKQTGSLVLCLFSRNKQYYWGKIVRVWPEHGVLHYKVAFQDGSDDVEEDITEFSSDGSEQYIFSVSEAEERNVEIPYDVGEKDQNGDLLEGQLRGARDPQVHDYFQMEELRCKRCYFCRAKDCGECHSCRSNRSANIQGKASCVRKMCHAIPLKNKMQPAPGFSPGWRFVFCRKDEHDGSAGHYFAKDFIPLQYIQIFSPDRQTFRSVDLAFENSTVASWRVERAMLEFLTFVGAHVARDEPNHPLIGKVARFEWLSLCYRKKQLKASVISAKRFENGQQNSVVKIRLDERGRKYIQEFSNPFDRQIAREKEIEETNVYGGAILHFERRGERDDIMNVNPKKVTRWRVPDEVMTEEDGTPSWQEGVRLMMEFKNFLLTFSIKESTVRDAGKGAFVSCRPISDESGSSLVLGPGELMDIGIYSPLQENDIKGVSVFAMKNFVLALRPEEYSFNDEDQRFQLDITDDVTGDCHQKAQGRVHMYVNECSDPRDSSLHAEHDLQGNVHYLMGFRSKEFEIPANGKDIELFVNYGVTYESVRIRKGYSTLDAAEIENRKKQLALNDIEYLESAALDLSPEDLGETVEFFTKNLAEYLTKGATSTQERLVAIAILCRHRATRLLASGPSEPELKETFESASHLTSTLLDHSQNKKWIELNSRGDHKELVRECLSNLLGGLGTPKTHTEGLLKRIFEDEQQ